jgi:hypothetical protein
MTQLGFYLIIQFRDFNTGAVTRSRKFCKIIASTAPHLGYNSILAGVYFPYKKRREEI